MGSFLPGMFFFSGFLKQLAALCWLFKIEAAVIV
jgi:hypothetical protein